MQKKKDNRLCVGISSAAWRLTDEQPYSPSQRTHADPCSLLLNARPLSPLLSSQPSSHSGQKIEDTHRALTGPVAPQSLCQTHLQQLAVSRPRGAPSGASGTLAWTPAAGARGGVAPRGCSRCSRGKIKSERRPVSGVIVHAAAELSLLWDPSHSAKIASYKS